MLTVKLFKKEWVDEWLLLHFSSYKPSQVLAPLVITT